MLSDKNETIDDSKTINVQLNKQGNNLHIDIYDTGKGIANIDNIFVPFYTTKSQGSGISLALCRQILFNHNGTISLANREDSNGAVVSLVIPQKG